MYETGRYLLQPLVSTPLTRNLQTQYIMTSSSDEDRKRRKKKSRKHGSSSRDDDRRHSSKESSSSRRHHRDKDEGGDKHHHTKSKNELTEEEERLYAKAQEFVKREKERDTDDKRSSSRKKHDSKHNKRRHDDDSSSCDDHRTHSKKKRKKEDKSSSRHDKKKSNHHHHHSRRDDDDDKKKKKHKHHDHKKKVKPSSSFRDKSNKIDTTNLISLGDIMSQPPSQQLDPTSDYFSHNSHLRLYLYRKYGIYFEDLSSFESHKAFEEFINVYNAGNKLEQAYYNETLPQEAIDQCSRTQHQWKFRTNKLEQQSLEMVRAGVKKQTEYSDDKEGGRAEKNASAYVMNSSRGVAIGPTARPQKDGHRTPEEIASQRKSDKQHRERTKLANEEMYGAGKADAGSHERKLQNKREQSSKLHGAARDRESEAYGGAELNDDDIYGSGSGGVGRGKKRGKQTYEAALSREKAYRQRKETEKASRVSELLQKEEERKKAMFAQLGLDPSKVGKKIQIAPRND